MSNTSDLSNGLIIRHNNELCQVVKYQHTMPGKGGAFYQVKLKNIKTGKSLDTRFRSGENINVVRIDKKEMQYIYKEGDDDIVLMDKETFEQINVSIEKIPENERAFLKEEMILFVSFEEKDVLFVNLPTFVELEVTYSEPAIKGDTSSSPSKPSTLETGAIINVPLFVNTGDVVKVDTRDGSYVERVSK